MEPPPYPDPDRYRLLVESVENLALVLLDPDGTITSWNPGAQRVSGYRSVDALGRPFAVPFGDARILPQAIASGGPTTTLQTGSSAVLTAFDTPSMCRKNCSVPKCGDGVLDGGEVCDDGNTVGGDGCAADCKSFQ